MVRVIPIIWVDLLDSVSRVVTKAHELRVNRALPILRALKYFDVM